MTDEHKYTGDLKLLPLPSPFSFIEAEGPSSWGVHDIDTSAFPLRFSRTTAELNGKE
jgi:hypothetical protein